MSSLAHTQMGVLHPNIRLSSLKHPCRRSRRSQDTRWPTVVDEMRGGQWLARGVEHADAATLLVAAYADAAVGVAGRRWLRETRHEGADRR